MSHLQRPGNDYGVEIDCMDIRYPYWASKVVLSCAVFCFILFYLLLKLFTGAFNCSVNSSQTIRLSLSRVCVCKECLFEMFV